MSGKVSYSTMMKFFTLVNQYSGWPELAYWSTKAWLVESEYQERQAALNMKIAKQDAEFEVAELLPLRLEADIQRAREELEVARIRLETPAIEKVGNSVESAILAGGDLFSFQDGKCVVDEAVLAIGVEQPDDGFGARLRVRRELNVKRVIAGAVAYLLEGDVEVGEGEVDPDKMHQIFEHAASVSSEYMQTIWARVLACEFASPGACSMKALEVLKTMGKQDAERFLEIASCAWAGMYLLAHTFRGPPFFGALDLMWLGRMGLCRTNEIQMVVSGPEEEMTGRIGGMRVVYLCPDSLVASDKKALGVFSLTFVGLELLRLADCELWSPSAERVAEIWDVMGFVPVPKTSSDS